MKRERETGNKDSKEKKRQKRRGPELLTGK
jgi:hypothetical protein